MHLPITAILRQYDFNLIYTNELVRDLEENQMTLIPAEGLGNHPGWADLFLRKGPGDPRMPDPDEKKYPLKRDLLMELEKQHDKVKNKLLEKTPEELNAQFTWRFGKLMPTLLDLTIFMCVNHEAMHLGQLAAWRRAMGLPSALVRV